MVFEGMVRRIWDVDFIIRIIVLLKFIFYYITSKNDIGMRFSHRRNYLLRVTITLFS